MAKLDIVYLADRLNAAPLLAAWLAAEWGDGTPRMEPAAVTDRLLAQASRETPPVCLLGFADDRLIATATLKYRELEFALQADYWLGSVYVREDMRGHGHGRAIIEAARQVAIDLSLLPLYLYTPHKESLYRHLGWETVGHTRTGAKQATVMVWHA